jgi:bifunctional enzyme CysN/CysC
MIRAQVERVHFRIDLATLGRLPAERLELDDIGRLTVTGHQPLYYDAYARNRATGSFVIVDSLTNNTVGAGMIVEDDGAATQDLDAALREAQAGATAPARTQVSPRERAQKTGQSGVTVLVSTAAPGTDSGASAAGFAARARELGFALERRLYDLGHAANVLAFTDEPAAAVALAARACTDAGLIVVCVTTEATIVRTHVGADRTLDLPVDDSTPIDAAVERAIALLGQRGQLKLG